MMLFAFGAFVGAVVALISVLGLDYYFHRHRKDDDVIPTYRPPYH